jgi:hypothetical protein
MIALGAIAIGAAYMLADRHLPLWLAGRQPRQGFLSRLALGRTPRSDP